MDAHSNQRHQGKVALVSGCGAALCGAIAKRMAETGAQVVINQAQESAEIEALARAIGATLAIGDPSEPDVAARVVDKAQEQAGPIDLFVFGASTIVEAPFLECEPTDWWKQIEVNLSAAYYLTYKIWPPMQERQQESGGRIVFVASSAGITGWPNASAASAASAGLITLTKALGRELAPEVIVNCIATGQLDVAPYDVNAVYGPVVGADAPLPPIGRVGTADEIAVAVDFLLSYRASGFVGHVVMANGGAIRTLA